MLPMSDPDAEPRKSYHHGNLREALVEWPERAGSYLPDWRLDVTIDFSGEGRRVTLEPRGEGWQTRLHGF